MGNSIRRTAMLVAFPVLFLSLLLTERLATHSLASNPSSSFLWRVSLELRGLFREISNWLDLLSSDVLWVQIVSIIGLFVVIFCASQVRRGSAFCFLANHILLLAAGFATVVANNFRVASFDVINSASTALFFTLDFHLSFIQEVVLTAGTVSCLYCHVVLLSAARQKTNALANRSI